MDSQQSKASSAGTSGSEHVFKPRDGEIKRVSKSNRISEENDFQGEEGQNICKDERGRLPEVVPSNFLALFCRSFVGVSV